MDYAFILTLVGWIIAISLASAIAFLTFVSIFNRTLCKRCTSTASLKGKTAIITGSSAGIGMEAAKDFAERGARVILACRNLKKAQIVADHIVSSTGNTNVVIKLIDTSLMSSVRSFAKKILEEEKQLDILVLNAGTGRSGKEKITTCEGLEITMATNHFGHFLLVNLLMDLLKLSKPSRVIFTSSQMQFLIKKMDSGNINFHNGGYSPWKAYALSKLCNVLTARYLAAQVYKKGVTFNTFCPGVVKTEIFKKSGGITSGTIFKMILSLGARSAKDGAQTLIHLAVSEDVADITGGHFMDCQVRTNSKFADDAGLVKKVWEKSEDLILLNPEERFY